MSHAEEENTSYANTETLINEITTFCNETGAFPSYIVELLCLMNKSDVKNAMQKTFNIDDLHYQKILTELKQEAFSDTPIYEKKATNTTSSSDDASKSDAEKIQAYKESQLETFRDSFTTTIDRLEQMCRLDPSGERRPGWLDLMKMYTEQVQDPYLNSNVLKGARINTRKLFSDLDAPPHMEAVEAATYNGVTRALENFFNRPEIQALTGEKPDHHVTIQGFAAAPNISKNR
jgi:hypothetical protein